MEWALQLCLDHVSVIIEDGVSILVLMEWALQRDYKKKYPAVSSACFNPCLNGMGTSTEFPTLAKERVLEFQSLS